MTFRQIITGMVRTVGDGKSQQWWSSGLSESRTQQRCLQQRDFAGISANTPWYNLTMGIDMLIGSFLFIIPALALRAAAAKSWFQ